MSTLSRQVVTAITAAITAALAATGCGVGSDDKPEPVDDTSITQAPATPSVDSGQTARTGAGRPSRDRPLTDVPATPVHDGSLPETTWPTPDHRTGNRQPGS